MARHDVLDDGKAKPRAALLARGVGIDPIKALGEARQIRDLAAAEHWHTVIVVTSVPHVSRARYITGKCWAGALVMQGTPAHLGPLGWAAMYVYQSAGYLKSVLHGSC